MTTSNNGEWNAEQRMGTTRPALVLTATRRHRGKEPLTALGGRVVHPSLECGQAERLEHFFQRPSPGFCGLDGQPRWPRARLGQLFPGGAEPGLTDLVMLG